MTIPNSIHHPGEERSNDIRDKTARLEPRALRTFTPTLAVLARSAGVFSWTPEGRRLFDFTSGVLVSNLGHNPTSWLEQFWSYLGWKPLKDGKNEPSSNGSGPVQPFLSAQPLTAYNAVTFPELEATRRLVDFMKRRPGGQRMEQVLWAASGSEAIQKALWAALKRDPTRDIIIATRHGFHGKKGLAGAVTGTEFDHDRDPRVRFINFPMQECLDVSMRDAPFDPSFYLNQLEDLKTQFGRKLGVLITEPYLGGGGSFHPPKAYLQTLQQFCRDNDIVFILDEVQANFGRTGQMFAFETYGIEPDIVVLGKGLGNGVPVACAVGLSHLFGKLEYGEGSDTWSGNPLCCAGVLATLDELENKDILAHSRKMSAKLEEGLLRFKKYPFIAFLRGEKGGMVWGLETCDHEGVSAAEWANRIILSCYHGNGNDGIHLLGPLAKKVIRIAPPLVISEGEVEDALALMDHCLEGLLAAPNEKGQLVGR
jgi:4-aminobutyrate aminotransferase-like enzyme